MFSTDNTNINTNPCPVNGSAADCQLQARESMAAENLDPGAVPVMDGKIHRFKTVDDATGETSGWYVFYADGSIAAGAYGDWRSGLKSRWHANPGRDMTQDERDSLAQLYEAIRAEREREERDLHAKAALECAGLWNVARPAAEHPYLTRKGIDGAGLRVAQNGELLAPIYNEFDAAEVGTSPCSLQRISDAGGDARPVKRFYCGGEISGCFMLIKAAKDTAHAYLGEGVATMKSVAEATGALCVVAYSAGNMPKVAERIAAEPTLKGLDWAVIADNDASGTGQKSAREASAALGGCRVVMPPEQGTDANDYAALHGLDALRELVKRRPAPWLHSFSELLKQSAPTKWLVRDWLPQGAMCMAFGPSCAGKSLAMLDMACAIAAPEIPDWHGFPVTHGRVVYLSGEGYSGIVNRAAAWGCEHSAESPDIFVADKAFDLNTDEGFSAIFEGIRGAGAPNPVLIIVDTLNRFLAGDENKAIDAKTMIDNLARLSEAFGGCATILVHHTGVSPEAQKRARGSSAWRGAMDIEICVQPGGSDHEGTITLEQTKNKDGVCAEKRRFAIKPVVFANHAGDLVDSVVLADSGEPDGEPAAKGLSYKQNLGIETWFEAAEKCGSLDADGTFAGIDDKTWRARFYARHTSNIADTKKKDFQRVRADLVKLGKMSVENDIYMPIAPEYKQRLDTLIAEIRNRSADAA